MLSDVSLWCRYKDDGSNAPALFSPRGGPFPVRQTTQGDLYFANVQFDDSGQYFCVAYNEHAVPSSRTSPSASLMVEGQYHVQDKPKTRFSVPEISLLPSGHQCFVKA